MSFNVSKSVLIAGGIAAFLLVYFGVRTLLRDDPVAADVPTTVETEAATLPTLITEAAFAQPHMVYDSLKGRTEPNRMVSVRSETTGIVTDASVQEGRFVEAGTLLCALNIDSREARLAEAEAAVEANRLEYEAAKRLNAQGLTASNRAAAVKAAYDQAEASLKAARIELERTKIRAPFDGIFELREAEQGAFLAPGSSCGQIVDLDPIIIAVGANETQTGRLAIGAPAEITLVDGRTLEDKIRFIARTANDVTRTFRIEVEAPNPGHEIPAGLTASLRIAMGEAPAIRLTPAALVLHDDGRVGVRYVDQDNVVQFSEVAVIDDDPAGVWVTGLPAEVTLVAEGQEYVREGVEVIPQPKGGL